MALYDLSKTEFWAPEIQTPKPTTSEAYALAASVAFERFCKILKRRATAQVKHSASEAAAGKGAPRPDRAVQMAIVSTIGEWLEWSIEDAAELAHEVLEDVNGHDLAAGLREVCREAEIDI